MAWNTVLLMAAPHRGPAASLACAGECGWRRSPRRGTQSWHTAGPFSRPGRGDLPSGVGAAVGRGATDEVANMAGDPVLPANSEFCNSCSQLSFRPLLLAQWPQAPNTHGASDSAQGGPPLGLESRAGGTSAERPESLASCQVPLPGREGRQDCRLPGSTAPAAWWDPASACAGPPAHAATHHHPVSLFLLSSRAQGPRFLGVADGADPSLPPPGEPRSVKCCPCSGAARGLSGWTRGWEGGCWASESR